MRKKRRLILFIANFIAASLAVVSAWLQWWRGAWPAETDFNAVLGSANLAPVNFWAFSVAMIIFVAAALMLLAAVGGWKWLGFLGSAVGTAVIVLWFMNSGLVLDVQSCTIDNVGYGTLAMAAAVIIALLALFVPRRRESLR